MDRLPPDMDTLSIGPLCLVCQGATAQLLDGIHDLRFGVPGRFEVRRCCQCGLEQVAPVLTPGDLADTYERFYNFEQDDTARYTKRRSQLVRSGLYRAWVWLDGDISFVLRPGRGRRLLDVGCNEGRNLQLYERSGFRPEGVETNPVAAARARERGCVVHLGDMANMGTDDGDYDVVVLSNVLEHVIDPSAMLDGVLQRLTPGGELWISCPNAESTARRLFGRSWINWHPPFHLTHFTAGTLRSLLERTGFEVVEMKTLTPALWIAQSVAAACWGRPGIPTLQMRKPAIMAPLMLSIRGLLFPLLWVQNRKGSGDCLVVTARRRGTS
jgi:2-polyprenyl-3-methyl-5-hydroxy-6-metoxy-1,4-benzoquinol methylase